MASLSSSTGRGRQTSRAGTRRILRTSTIAFGSSALALGSSLVLLAPGISSASSHREAPLLLTDGQVDHTDVYAFVSPDKADTVTLIANVSPFQDPAGGPNFYPFATDAHYDININNNGDATSQITYRWTFKTDDKRGTSTFLYNNGPVKSFKDATLLFKQTYKLEEIKGGVSKVLADNVPVAPSNVGKASMPNYAALRQEARVGLPGGGMTFAGQADDPFFLDLRVFDLLYGGNLSETGFNTIAGKNVNTIALQVPIKDITAGGDPVIGVYATNERPSMRVQGADGTQKYSGDYVQVSRLGMPLVNEVVVPAGLKDAFNALPPSKDRTVPEVVARVNDPEVPKLIEKIYGIKAPPAPRNDIAAIFLTGLKGLNQPAKPTPAEMLRLNTSIKPSKSPNRLGVLAGDNSGFPNGRRLADDVVDIEIQALEGAVSVDKNGAPTGVNLVKALATGDKVNANDVAFGASFPYVALPHSGSSTSGSTNGTNGPSGAMNTGVEAASGNTSMLLSASGGGAGVLLAGLGFLLFRRERRRSSKTVVRTS